MKLALVAMVSGLALSVKSVSYVTSLGIPDGGIHYKSTLPYYTYSEMPVIDVQSSNLICRTPDMSNKLLEPFQVPDGTTIRVYWDTKAVSPYSNKPVNGPCSFWLAPVASGGKGKVWSKIHQYTYRGNDEAAYWCSSSIDSKGYYDVPLPKGMPPGKYYLRSEVIDLDGAREKSNYLDFTAGARFHVNCQFLEITGTGTTPLASPVSIMDAYSKYYKTTLFPLTMKNTEFIMPGDSAPYRSFT